MLYKEIITSKRPSGGNFPPRRFCFSRARVARVHVAAEAAPDI
jgi:hypothetical protein